MKKNILLLLLLLLCSFVFIGCNEKKDDNKTDPNPIDNKDIDNDEDDDDDKPSIVVPQTKISIGIVGTSEVKSGNQIKLSCNVTGFKEDDSVTWSIKKGSEFATIDQTGRLSANEVDGDKIIEVKAVSNEDKKSYATKVITIVSRPALTQEMLDKLNVEKLSFEGYINVNLYNIDFYGKLYRTFSTPIQTAMDGTNWYGKYEDSNTGLAAQTFYKNHDGVCCEVGISFMNEEQYYPLLNDNKTKEVSWEDAGFYNCLKDLNVRDFKFNDNIWRWEYVGSDKEIVNRIVASANPYKFEPLSLSLIVEDNEVLGLYSMAKDDYTIASGYKAVNELFVAINYEDTAIVPAISKFSHEEIHNNLETALSNMRNLDNYTLDFQLALINRQTNSRSYEGYTEYITSNENYFVPYKLSTDKLNNIVKIVTEKADNGYKKISDNLYNSYFNNGNGYSANRAFESDFKESRPSFGVASELFRTYYIDEEKNTTTYYIDELMKPAASTFYKGIGNDADLYGIFAQKGVNVNNEFYTPYLVVKDDYIISSGFYFDMGALAGAVEITYSDFNNTSLPEGFNVSFDTRNIPTSWSDLTILKSENNNKTDEDEEINAVDYITDFFEDENAINYVPLFNAVLGDTYGFGMNMVRTCVLEGKNTFKDVIAFYYDVPLDIDYTINKSIRNCEDYLETLGFVRNSYGQYQKDDYFVEVVDSSLDLMIYVFKK